MGQMDTYLAHYGIKRRSGRYPWGSGGDPYQSAIGFQSFLKDLKKENPAITQSEIAKYISDLTGERFSTADLRAHVATSTEAIRGEKIATATKLRATGMSPTAIGREMAVRESTVRGWLESGERAKEGSIRATADVLKQQLETKPFLDVGKGTHLYLGVSSTKLNTALALLEQEGYKIHPVKVPQLGAPGKMTELKILTKGVVDWARARVAVLRGETSVVAAQSDDNGETFRIAKLTPKSASSKRIEIAYAEDGGATKDGVIELRRGVSDLNLGANNYGQVRIAVDGTHYLKGMAMYADDLPPGVDMRFNTNKSRAESGSDPLAVMKPMKMADGKIDENNPFGSSTYPMMYTDSKGEEKQSMLNVVGTPGRGNLEGRWDQWSDNLSSQMLSKQPLTLASTQLGLARTAKERELAEIMSLTNPVVKQKMLDQFADSADAAAVHLKAAAMKDQSTHVLLPMNSMRPHEIYAPNFRNGDKVVLVRHPHGGPFEVPELTVNNLNRTAKRVMGGATDAVGIHHTVAEQLSGADFDGDTVLVIPNNEGRVKTRPPLKELKNFDAKHEYRKVPGMREMSKEDTQREMGRISNLITDMTIQGAEDSEIARAVRHSMVVIDAEKHGLNYKKSEQDHNISQLKRDYQGGANKGASTIISRASSEIKVPERKLRKQKDGGPVDPKTGELVWEETGRTWTRTVRDPKTGQTTTEEVPNTTKVERAAYVKDARELVSPKAQPMETIYADHSNSMKSLANEARRQSYAISKTPVKQSDAAKKVYAKEVDSLKKKLAQAERSAPLERRAQVLGNAMARQRIESTPDIDKDGIKKAKYQSLAEAREITEASKTRVHISDREWEAIQSRAVSKSMLTSILNNADKDRVRELATPKYRGTLTPGQLARAKAMVASGKSMVEVADNLGLPRSTVVDNINNS